MVKLEKDRYYVIKQSSEFLFIMDDKINKMGVRKQQGSWVIDPKYNFLDLYENEQLFFCVEEIDGVEKFIFIDVEGNKIKDQYYDLAYGFFMGMCVVELDGKMNVINDKCDILSDKWFSSLSYPVLEVNKDNTIDYIIEGTYIDDEESTYFLLKEGKLFKK